MYPDYPRFLAGSWIGFIKFKLEVDEMEKRLDEVGPSIAWSLTHSNITQRLTF